MAHYAFLDENNYVVQVIEGTSDLIEGKDARQWYEDFAEKKCVETSPFGEFRCNFAGIGSYYDEQRNAFIGPQSFPSWTLDKDTCQWKPPVTMPLDGKLYDWDENITSWVEVSA